MIRFDRFTFTFPGTAQPQLSDLTLVLPEGCLTLVTGPSGAGKSTLLRAINGLVPHFSGGAVSGLVRVGPYDPVALGPSAMSGIVGFVAGDPERWHVMDIVADEVAFALENQGLDALTLRRRVAGALERVGLADAAERPLATLSGGERQRVQVAAALALSPRVLVLDEPTSQLDDDNAAAVLATVAELGAAGDLTVVLSEHRLARVLPHAGWRLHLPGGDGASVSGPPSAPGWPVVEPPLPPAPSSRGTGEVLLELDDVWFAHGPRPVLSGASLAVRAGEVVALTGPNGSGKTTLLRLAVGLLQPARGAVGTVGRHNAGRDVADICRQVAYLPQDPSALLFADTVRGELLATLANHGLPPSGTFDPDPLLADLGLADLAERYPRDLSTGQRQRVALGAVTVTRPPLLLLDEPTRGLDDAAISALARLLHERAADGAAVLVATHDQRLVRATGRVVALRAGRVYEVASAEAPAGA
jgi:energy-coupling factor transport system ATP-binding protein